MSPAEQKFLDLLRAGDDNAARQVFNAFVNRLLELARWRLNDRLARRVDPEDIVQSVFRTFFSRVKAGHFVIDDLDDLGKILTSITVRKTLRQAAFHRAAKRDTRLESDARDPSGTGLMHLQALEPTPEAAASFADLLEHFLARLRHQDRRILEMRLQGYRNEEIAREIGSSDRHVRRALGHIRAVAEREELQGLLP
jgi:RNA polymerase sigma-70 factor (ECF subfamily)